MPEDKRHTSQDPSGLVLVSVAFVSHREGRRVVLSRLPPRGIIVRQLRLRIVRVLEGELTPSRRWGLEVVLVNPQVGSEFEPSGGREGFVVRPQLRQVVILVHDGRPQHSRAFSRIDRDPKVIELCAPCLWRREVHEEGVQTGALGREGCRILVVVHLVELPRLVPHHLEILGVLRRGHGDRADAVSDTLDDRVVLTLRMRAPALM
mmetsp:Transcript_28410/g.64345  ORF Transcript_28410/g.64345 Transcript_28410/m.64345 type:complete len:206 (+) Transcript_28410:436-1053(+)